MKNLNVLIKASSNKCNLNCKYCFYYDISENRETYDYDFMSLDTAYKIIENIFSNNELQNVNIGFQGGEPTLSGIEFYKKFFEYVTKNNKNNVKTTFSFQTNGILIDDDWIKLFLDYNVLVGISLDGPSKIHDSNRITNNNKNSHAKVLNSIKLMQKNNVTFNILSVVTSKNAKSIDKIYEYFTKNNLNYLQFIPSLNPINYKTNNLKKANQEYYDYLNNLFKCWFTDYKNGKYVSVRYIDNLINIIAGNQPEACDMRGACSIQNVIEADGTTFTCDFYAMDKYIIGNAKNDTFESMLETKIAKDFVIKSASHPKECQTCPFHFVCRNGCARMRVNGKYMYCDAMKQFLRKNGNVLHQIANQTHMK